ncbi:MAG: hypothetical protein K2Y26_17085, partial [Gemmatimonadaceae bacterium]|nr:hypothetical protein [Gemmatimonadaceae bacterium]
MRSPTRFALRPLGLALAALTTGVPATLLAQDATPANPFTAVSRWTPPPLPAGKKPITQDVYDLWRTISGSSLSNDGKWAVYTQSPVVGEGELVVRATSGSTEYRVPRGFTGRPQLMPSADSGAQFSAQPAQISADSRVVVFTIYPSRAEVERVRGRRGAPAPRNSMGIMQLADGAVTRVPAVRSFRLARNGGRFLAYQVDDTTARPQNGAGGAAAGAGQTGASAQPAGPRRDYGNTLVLRDLSNGSETRIEGVTSFTFDENEKYLGYTVTTRDGAGNGAFVRTLASGAVTPLLTGQATYRGFGFDRAGTQVAFVSDVGDSTSRPRFALYHASLVPAKGKPVAARRLVSSADVPGGLLVAERGQVGFTRDGSGLIFSLANPPMDSIPADSLADKAVYDLW